MKNIGLILPNLSASQLAFEFITQANKISFCGEYECILFPLSITTQCIKPNVSIMNISEIYNFNDILIATNLYSASYIANLKNNARKIFYIWDLEWLRGKINYIENIQVYSNPKLELVCRSEDHAEILENYCNIKPRIVEDCNIIGMIE